MKLIKRKSMLKYLYKTCLVSFSLVLLTSPISPLPSEKVFALTVSDDNFMIDISNVDTAVDTSPQEKPQKTETQATQLAPGQYTGTNYSITEGFSGFDPLTPLSFGISETLMDYGVLSATNPVTRTNKLSVISQASPYQIFAFEDHQLYGPNKAQIPDTTCDNGSCTDITQAPWTSNLTYGFGYRCDNTAGTDCAEEFSDTDSFKQFPAVSDKEIPEALVIGKKSNDKKEDQITYKVNISGTQAAGPYTNTIMFIAAPGY